MQSIQEELLEEELIFENKPTQMQENSQEFSSEAEYEEMSQENIDNQDFLEKESKLENKEEQIKHENNEKDYEDFANLLNNENLKPAFIRNILEENLNEIKGLEENEKIAKVFDELDTQEKLKENLSNNQEQQQKIEKQIQEREKSLQENPNFTDDKKEEKEIKSLETLKKELQRLKDEEENIKQSQKDNNQNIESAIAELFSAKDINQLIRAMMKIIRGSSKARLLSQNFKDKKAQRKEKNKEIEEIKAKDEQIEEFLKVFEKVGDSKEAKELMYVLLKNMREDKKVIEKDYTILEKEQSFYKDIESLLRKRENTNNLEANTKDLQKLFEKINKETPNFKTHYPKAFESTEYILKTSQEKTQSQSLSA